MENDFIFLPISILQQTAVTDILLTNEVTSKHGLILSSADAKDLAETRQSALNSFGRIEFGGGVISKLIKVFCDSPYINQHDYAEILNELIEIFYFYKNETLDVIGDDEMLEIMKDFFDNRCRGSLELLEHRELETLSRNIRYGILNYEDIDEKIEDDQLEEEL